MLRGLLLAGWAALALAACGQEPAPAPKEEAASVELNGCPAHAAAPWRTQAGAFVVAGVTEGVDCTHATATLSVSDADGHVVYSSTSDTADLMTLARAGDVEAMQAALVEWIDTARAAGSTNTLPEWAPGAENPARGEFPFYPEERVSRDVYHAIRAANAPMFCYVQGMESQACIAWYDGEMMKVGVQTFPG